MIETVTTGAAVTSLRIGGPINLHTPRNGDEFFHLVESWQEAGQPFTVLGKGSNSVFRDEGNGEVISTEKLTGVADLGGGRLRVQAGAMLPKLVIQAKAAGYGGFEFLVSVPGTVGGALVTNAGEGIGSGNYISNVIERVDVIQGGKFRTLSREQCKFGYRRSIFLDDTGIVILSAILRCEEKSQADIAAAIKRRKSDARAYYDLSACNAGSIYASPGKLDYKAVPPLEWSKKRTNWLLNKGHATFADLEASLPKMDGLELQILPRLR